jgi:DNA-binding NtrC family response regulator
VAAWPRLLLDRFIAVPGGGGIDLATGGRVWIRRTSPGNTALQQRRSSTAARVRALRVPGMAALVDYGIDRRGDWVEAYCDPGAGTSPVQNEAGRRVGPTENVRRLLAQAGCRVGSRSDEAHPASGERPLFVPIPVAVVELESDRAGVHRVGRRRGRALVGTIIQRRAELEQLAELAGGEDAPPGPRNIDLEAPAGAGVRTLFLDLARDARQLGYVPLASRVCGTDFVWPHGVEPGAALAVLSARHIMILDDRRPWCEAALPPPWAADVTRLLGRLEHSAGRPHLLVSARLPGGALRSIPIGPLHPDELRRSALCAGVSADPLNAAVEEAIRRSGGWPGLFTTILRAALGATASEEPYRPPGRVCHHVRESARQAVAVPIVPPDPPFDTAGLLERAGVLARKGRHAGAERLLRRAIGCLRRRGRTADAARAHLALGRLQATRGRRTAAREAFEASRRLSDEALDPDGVVRALLHLGAALIDEGTLQAAESTLRTAEVGARQGQMWRLGQAARVLIARCLFWQGKQAMAWRAVEEQVGSPAVSGPFVAEHSDDGEDGQAWGSSEADLWLPSGLSAVPVEIGVRAALLDRDIGQASRRLAAAGDWTSGDDPFRSGTLCGLGMLVQGAVGDGGAASRALTAGIELLRRRHAPAAAQELRITHLEALLAAGERTRAVSQLRRLLARRSPVMSGLARARVEDIADRLARPDEQSGPNAGADGSQIDAQAVVSILQNCHDADDDKAAAAGVCRAVQSTLGAAAVSAFQTTSGIVGLVANSGGRVARSEIAERCATALLIVGPEETPLGWEAAAPVRYGGHAVGAVAARWTADAVPDGGRVRGILAAAAAALGPAVAALAGSAEAAGRDGDGAGELCGASLAMVELRRQVTRAAAAPFPVLVQGESGTGKELIARAIHTGSLRRHRRFCAVNCAALSDDLFETELFGHARGAFTGASADRPGLFEEADGGTLLLDEVGELSPRAQAKLLRAIQEGEIRRVGENHPRRVDTRIVAATNRSLPDEVRAGRFRNDLLFRLDVVKIVVPPLRERPEDIGPLARLFWRDVMQRTGGRAELAPSTLAALARYDWPGNVRELQNTLAALAVRAPAKGRVGPSSLPDAIAGPEAAARTEMLTLDLARRRFEERFVRATLARAGGRRSDAAAALGLSRQGLAKLLARLGIDSAEGEEAAY